MNKLKCIIFLTAFLYTVGVSGDCRTLQGGVAKSRGLGMVGLTRGMCNKVVRVIRYSPAWLSDVQPGDIIVSVDGNKGKECRGIPGEFTTVIFDRNGKILTKSIRRDYESNIDRLASKYGYTKL